MGSLLSEVAASHPNHLAVIHRGNRLTYRDLEERANDVAGALLELGVRPGDRVGALLCNRYEWMVLAFATFKVGGTYLPINTWYRQEEIAWTLQHGGVSVLVLQESFLSHNYRADMEGISPGIFDAEEIHSASLPALRNVVVLDAASGSRAPLRWEQLSRPLSQARRDELAQAQAAVAPTDRALILYTSGSTAEPKGVGLAHGNLVENSYHIGERRWFAPGDKLWLGTPLFYALGASNAMPAAVTHATALVLQDHFEPRNAADLIAQEQCTIYYGLGNITRAILDVEDGDPSRLRSLEKGHPGTLPEDRRLTLETIGIRHAAPSYGLTEAYGNSTVGHPEDDLEIKLAGSGTALPGVEIEIRDQVTGKTLPPGRTGAVFLRGRVMIGYHDAVAGTSAAVGPDGFLETGDLGQIDGNGHFRFHSRSKEMVKSGGINVSPFEIERLLCEHPDVRQAYAIGVPDPSKGEVLVAFVECSGGASADDLKAYMRSRAASFKIPTHIFFRTESELPRVASGKVPRFRLREIAIEELS
jgi:fatty-acyl-CoA synthase